MSRARKKPDPSPGPEPVEPETFVLAVQLQAADEATALEWAATVLESAGPDGSVEVIGHSLTAGGFPAKPDLEVDGDPDATDGEQ